MTLPMATLDALAQPRNLSMVSQARARGANNGKVTLCLQ